VVERVQEQIGAERDAAKDKGSVVVVPVAVAVAVAVTPETAPTAVTPEMASAAAPPEIAPTAAMPEFASTAAVTGATPAEIAPAYLDHRGSVGQTCGRC